MNSEVKALVEEILAKAPSVNVLVVGDVMLDRYHWGDVSRISPEAPVPVVRLDRTTIAAGGAANVAANIVGLGASVRLFGLIGDDAEGDVLKREIERTGVSGDDLVGVGGRQTTVKTRIVAHGQHVVRLDQEDASSLAGPVQDALCADLVRALETSSIVVVSDYAKGMLTDELLARLITSARRSGIPVLVDPKGKEYAKYAGATMVTPNQKEALDACGLNSENSLEAAGRKLLTDLNLESALITCGAAGMRLFLDGAEPVSFTARARKVYDVTGAGDTVIAALGTALGTGAGLHPAVEFANLAAGIVVEQIGTTAITTALVRSYLEEHNQ